jgi:surface antigen
MLSKLSRIALSSLATLPVAGTLVTLMPHQAAEANTSCQCTKYVANRFGIGSYGHAHTWNDGLLQRSGFRQVSARPGAIVVMERSFPGANSAFGHVGVVESVNAQGKLVVRGANQSMGSPLFSEAGCSNVRTTPFATSINGRSDVSFWVR